MYTNTRPVTMGGAQMGESPTGKMFALPGRMCWAQF